MAGSGLGVGIYKEAHENVMSHNLVVTKVRVGWNLSR